MAGSDTTRWLRPSRTLQTWIAATDSIIVTGHVMLRQSGRAATITHRSPVLLIRHSDSGLSSVFTQTLRRLMYRLLFSAQNGTNQHK